MSKWPSVRLAEVADIRFSNVDKKTIPGEIAVRLCNYMDVYGNDYITADLPFMDASASRAEIARFGIGQGDVMITKDSETPDDIGISAVVAEEIESLVCGYHLALIKPDKTRIDPLYLAKQLRTIEAVRYFGQRANGSTRYGLSSAAIANIKIPLAPLANQRRIAEILGTVDEAIEQTEALIAKQQQVKAGLMHDLFTRGVTPAGQLRPPPAEAPGLYRDSPLGLLPREWQVFPYQDVCERVSVGIATSTTDHFSEHGVPILRNQNIRSGYIDLSDVLNITREFDALNRSKRLRAGDVVTVRTGYPGTSAVVPPELEGWQTFTTLISTPRPDRITSEFLCELLNSHFGKTQIARLQGGGAQQNLNVGWLVNFVVPLPSISEQRTISASLQNAVAVLNAETAHLAKLRPLKQGLMQDILNGFVPVPI